MQQADTDTCRRNGIGTFAVNFGLLAAAVLLFALPQPNSISFTGFPILAYFSLLPLFLLVRRVSFRATFLWGGMYGLLSYCVFSYWLGSFHPLALYLTGILYFCFLMIVFPVLKLADIQFPRYGYIVQSLVWVGFEYLKTLGFIGYSYGIIGYSQWSLPVIIQIASIFGVWGVSALVVFPSAWIAGGLKAGCTGKFRSWPSGFPSFARANALAGFLWLAAFAATIFYGIVSPVDYSKEKTVTIALIQPNSDPWIGGINAYNHDFNTLVRLSEKALAERPDIGLVVWPETAFIPRIDWHYRYREDHQMFELVSSLLEWLDKAPVPFLLGNDDAVMGPIDDGTIDRVDYNAALVFRPGKNVLPPEPERYRKMHLVPFTEHFPYRKQFPWLYDFLIKNDTHFWEQGHDPVVFSVNGLSFSTPICFEDTFGYISRRFVNHGARAIVNISDDAWAKSVPCQYQHLSMSVFRAVENRVPLVRSTASGQTCIIDPNGKVVAMAEPFTETWLTGSIPLLSRERLTPYRVWGDLLGQLCAGVSVLVIVGGLLTKLRYIYDN